MFTKMFPQSFMAWWEEEAIINDTTPELIFWRYYIDDEIFKWVGSVKNLHDFMSRINNNNWGIRFTYEYSTTELYFLL